MTTPAGFPSLLMKFRPCLRTRLEAKAGQHPPSPDSGGPAVGDRRVRGRPAPRPALLAIAALAVASGAGFVWVEDSRDLSLPADTIVDAEHFLCSESFSEVEAARTRIRAMARRSLTAFRVKHMAELRLNPAQRPQPLREDAGVLRELRERIQEFADTDGESVFVEELLRILRRERQPEAWMRQYREFAARRPGDPLVRYLADEALRLGSGTVGHVSILESHDADSEALPTLP